MEGRKTFFDTIFRTIKKDEKIKLRTHTIRGRLLFSRLRRATPGATLVDRFVGPLSVRESERKLEIFKNCFFYAENVF